PRRWPTWCWWDTNGLSPSVGQLATTRLPHRTDSCWEDLNRRRCDRRQRVVVRHIDRKSTRLNSSHGSISYAVFCLKKKKIRKLAMILIGEHTQKILCKKSNKPSLKDERGLKFAHGTKEQYRQIEHGASID